MREPTALDRVVMVGKTIAAIVTWVVALGVSMVRGKIQK